MSDRFPHVSRSYSQSNSSSGQSYHGPRSARSSGRPRHCSSTSRRNKRASRLERPGVTSTCRTSSVSQSTAAQTKTSVPSTSTFVSSMATSGRSWQSGSKSCFNRWNPVELFHVTARRTVGFDGRTIRHDREMPRGHADRAACPLDEYFLLARAFSAMRSSIVRSPICYSSAASFTLSLTPSSKILVYSIQLIIFILHYFQKR